MLLLWSELGESWLGLPPLVEPCGLLVLAILCKIPLADVDIRLKGPAQVDADEEGGVAELLPA